MTTAADRRRAADPLHVYAIRGTPDNLDGFDLRSAVEKLLPIMEAAKTLPTSNYALKPADVRAVLYTLIVHESRRGRALQEDHLILLEAALDFRSLSSAARDFLRLAPVRSERLYKLYLALAQIDAGKQLSARAAARELKKKCGSTVDDKTVRAWRGQDAYRRRRQDLESVMLRNKKLS